MARSMAWLALAAVLTGCGNLPAESFKPAGETIIQVSDNRFSPTPDAVFAAETECGRKEIAVRNSGSGVVQIVIIDAAQGCIVRDPLDDDEAIALKFDWLMETGVRFEGAPSSNAAPVGMIWGRPFSRQDRECYFFRHVFEAHHFSHYSEPMAYMVGFFCGPPGWRNDDTSIRQFISGITLLEKPVKLPKKSSLQARVTVAWTNACG